MRDEYTMEKATEFLYLHFSGVITCLGFGLSIIIAICTLPKEEKITDRNRARKIAESVIVTKKNRKRYFHLCVELILIGLVTCILVFLVENYKLEHTPVPEIGEGESLDYVLGKFQDAGLPEPAIIYDEIAKRKLAAGADIDNHFFIVSGCSKEAGKIVGKEEKIELYVAWRDPLNSRSVEDSWQEDFKADEFYAGISDSDISEYHTGVVELFISRAAAKMTAGNEIEPPFVIYPPRSEKTIVEAELIDFYTQEVVDEEAAFMGDEIIFSNVQTGTYYYKVFCAGYNTSVSEAPFRIVRDDSREEEDCLFWNVDMDMAGDSYSAPFKVRLVDSEGDAVTNASVSVHAVSREELEPSKWFSHNFLTDEEGYLNIKQGEYRMDGGIAEFQVGEGHMLELEFPDYKFVPIEFDGSDEVCVTLDGM